MPARLVYETSAGGIVVRWAQGRFEACLIRRDRHGEPVWGLPKGHLEPGEDARAAAAREVQEETGVSGEILEELGTIAYQFTRPGAPARYAKTVHFFLMRAAGGSPDQHDPQEVLEARWMPFEEAVRLVAYANERTILERAQERLASPTLAAQIREQAP